MPPSLFFDADSLGVGDGDTAGFSLASLGIDRDSLATERFNGSVVRPDDDADRTPRAVLAYIDRVLNIVDPVRAMPTTAGRTTTVLPPRAELAPRPPRRPLERGRPADVLHYIDTVLFAFDDNMPMRRQHHFGRIGDDVIDREVTALRRAIVLRADADDRPADDVLPDVLEFVIPDRDDDRDAMPTRLLRTRRNANGALVRVTYPTGSSTKREWLGAIKSHVLRLRQLGLSIDDILDRLNNGD